MIFTSWYDVSHAMGFRVWVRNSIKNHLLCETINLCIKPGLNQVLPYLPSPTSLSHCSELLHCVSARIWGGCTKERICPTTWTDSIWRPVPSKSNGCLMPNLIGTYLCGAKNGKKICYRILDYREMDVEVLEVTITRTIRA